MSQTCFDIQNRNKKAFWHKWKHMLRVPLALAIVLYRRRDIAFSHKLQINNVTRHGLDLGSQLPKINIKVLSIKQFI